MKSDPGVASNAFRPPLCVPLSSESGTYKAVKAIFWLWLSGESRSAPFSCSLFAQKRPAFIVDRQQGGWQPAVSLVSNREVAPLHALPLASTPRPKVQTLSPEKVAGMPEEAIIQLYQVQTPNPKTPNPKPQTLNPEPQTMNPNPSTLHLKPSTLNPNPEPCTLNPTS